MGALLNGVRELAHEILDHSHVVELHEANMKIVAQQVRNNPEWNDNTPRENPEYVICKELIASSINYCYWYGIETIRPNCTSSVLMYTLLEGCSSRLLPALSHFYTPNGSDKDFVRLFKTLITEFYEKLVLNRFPLLESRFKHLYELPEVCRQLVIKILNRSSEDPEPIMHYMITHIPGFASDLFLKRAQLFIIQLHRSLGYFDTRELTVPADYQVPRVLNEFGCISYVPELLVKIAHRELIPSCSKEEISIRAATITACDQIAKLAGVDCVAVDNFLWQSKKKCINPFHLTITTDY